MNVSELKRLKDICKAEIAKSPLVWAMVAGMVLTCIIQILSRLCGSSDLAIAFRAVAQFLWGLFALGWCWTQVSHWNKSRKAAADVWKQKFRDPEFRETPAATQMITAKDK